MSAPVNAVIVRTVVRRSALLDPAHPIPHGVAARDTRSAVRRFAVHRNNVVASLVKAIAARFPAVQKIVGEDFFAAMARAFVVERPPRSPLLATYGDEFADFIGSFAPAANCPISPTWRGSRPRAPAPITPPTRPRSPQANWRHSARTPSAACASSYILRWRSCAPRIPIVTIWAMNSGMQAPALIESWSAEDALIVRPYLDVEVRLLPPGGAAFPSALAENRSLGEAANVALADHSDFDLTANLAGLIGWGLVRSVDLAERNERAPS